MLVEALGAFAAERLRPAALRRRRGLRAARRAWPPRRRRSASRCSACRRSWAGSTPSARRSPACWPPRRWPAATWAWPSRCSPRPAWPPRSPASATRTSRPPTCPRSPATTSRRPRSRCSSRARWPTRSRRPTTARRDGDDWVLDGEKALVPLGAVADLLIVGAATEDGPAAFLVETGFTASAEPAMGVRAARHRAGDASTACASAATRGCARATTTPSWSTARGSPGARWPAARRRAVLDYVIPYVNERRGVRRADLAPPGRRVHGGRRGDRGRGHAAGHAARRRAGRPGQARRARHRRSPTACAPTRARRSAPTACSCSAATATSRSTRWSAGTATCARSA